MVTDMKAIIPMESQKEKELISGVMVQFIEENSKMD